MKIHSITFSAPEKAYNLGDQFTFNGANYSVEEKDVEMESRKTEYVAELQEESTTLTQVN